MDYVRFPLHVIERTQDGGWYRVCTRKHQTNQPTSQIILTPKGLNKGYESLPNEYSTRKNITFQQVTNSTHPRETRIWLPLIGSEMTFFPQGNNVGFDVPRPPNTKSCLGKLQYNQNKVKHWLEPLLTTYNANYCNRRSRLLGLLPLFSTNNTKLFQRTWQTNDSFRYPFWSIKGLQSYKTLLHSNMS